MDLLNESPELVLSGEGGANVPNGAGGVAGVLGGGQYQGTF